MEAILVLKDTLDVHVLSTLTPICKVQTADSVSCICEFSQANMATSHDGIWITLIICATILLLTVTVVGLMLYYKYRRISDMLNERKEKDKAEENMRADQKAIEIEKEKKLYRERLANFLELQAKGITKEKDADFAFNPEVSKYYVAELKSYINDLRPTNTEYNYTPPKSKKWFIW